MGIEMPDINKIRKEMDEKNAEMEKKERERIKEEYERLSEQEKPTEEKLEEKPEERSEEEKKVEEPMQRKDIIEGLTPETVKAAENVEAAYKKGKFIEVKIKKSSGELEDGWVINKIDPKTGEVTVLKSTSGKGKDESFVDKIVTLQELKEWNKPETKEGEKVKGKKEKNKENKKEEKLNLWESYKKREEALSDSIFLSLYHLLGKDFYGYLDKNSEGLDYYLTENELRLSRETPVWVEEKTKKKQKKSEEKKQPKRKRAKTEDIEWKKTKVDKEKVDKVFKGTEERPKKQKVGKENLEKILQDPEVLSKIFYEASELSKNPEVQEKFQELKNTIEKIIKGKEEIPDSVAKAKEQIKKKESVWGTAFGAAGWGILLFLVLFILAELKGIEALSGQATGKKKEKK